MAEKTVAVEAKTLGKQLETKADDTKALVPVSDAVDKTPAPAEKKPVRPAYDRDAAFAEVEKGKKDSFIKAWEEGEKSKAVNKAEKKLSAVIAWENTKKAALEAKLRKIEEKLEGKKAKYSEKMSNKVAKVHKQAEEKKAMVQAQRGEKVLKAEEMAAKYRATGTIPKTCCGCF